VRRAYLAIGRILSPLFIIGLRFFTLLTGVERVRVIVLNERGEILLLKGVISDAKWSLPGGGIERGETPISAARRELLEETGIEVQEKDCKYLATLEKVATGASYRAPLFLLRIHSSALPDHLVNKWEIAEIGWFQMSKLPVPLSHLVEVAISTHKSDF